jgi:Neugrin
MSGTLQSQRALSAIFRFASRPAQRGFLAARRSSISRSFATAIPWRAPGGFSVSFPPEPDEPDVDVSAPSQAPTKKLKGKKKTLKKAVPAQEAKPQHVSEHFPDARSEQSPDNAEAVVTLGSFSTTLHSDEIPLHAEQAENTATRDGFVTNPDHENTVDGRLEDGPLFPDHLTTESLNSEDYLKPTLGGVRAHAHTKSGNSEPIAVKKKKKDKAKKKANAEFPADTGLFKDNTPINSGAPSEFAHSASLPERKGGNNNETGSPQLRSSSTQESRPLSEHNPTSKTSKVDLRLKAGTQDKPPRSPPTPKEPWQIQKQALQEKFGSEGWNPRKKLSPDTIDGIRALHEQYPDKYPTPILAEKFKVSAEAIRRILKSKWRPDPEKQAERRERWARRHDRIWDQQAAIGLRPARTKVKKPQEPGEEPDVEELHVARARKQSMDLHVTNQN